MGIEAWITTPAGVDIGHLDRSTASPFRNFAVSLVRNEPGAGSLEYHTDNALLTEKPELFDLGNLVWMKYRGTTRAWIIEDERATLDQNEHATDWRRVSGRGTLQLLGDRLVYPTDFAAGANLDPSTWASQWYSVVNVSAGTMLWNMIDASNARFDTDIVQGTVGTTGADGWTQDFRFENLLEDVVKLATDVHGDVEMAGLTFSYYTVQGTDKTDSVIFEEGADLLALTRDRSDRDALSYVVGEGVGEGVFAKLAIASRADARRKEGFLAAKEATNVPLLQNLTTAALAQNERREAVGFEIDESRFRVFTDYGLGDTVTAIALDGWETSQRIDAIYLAEDGDRVRVALDVNGLRDDELLRLYGEQRKTRQNIGVRNRQPQGQLVPFNFNGNGVFDAAEPAVIDFLISDRIYVTIETIAQFAFSEFWAPATAMSTDSGSTPTTTSGGGSTPTTTSGGSSTPTTSSGGSSTPTSSSDTSNTGINSSTHVHPETGTTTGANIESHFHATSHDHTVSVPAHDHSVTIDAHAHDVTVPAHAHDVTIPGHDHDITYGIFKEAMPGSHSVNVGVYEFDGASWDLVVSLSGLTDDVEELDLSQYIDGPGSWRLEIQSAAAQPNNGRLAVSVSGQVIGAIRSS